MSTLAALANAAWLGSSLGDYTRFRRHLRDPERAQTEWLRRHLQRHADSAYGRAHSCHTIARYSEFARRVPVVGYEELEPWIDRIRAGENTVLTRDRVRRLMPTSGSTHARKLIPYTDALQREFNAAIGPWIVDLCAAYPSMALGCAYWSVTPLSEIEATAESAVPIGFADDSDYLGGVRSRLVAAAMAVPSTTRHLRDVSQFRRTVLLHLLRRADLRLISVWHPSFFALLLDTLTSDWDTLLTELARNGHSRRSRELRSADPSHPRSIWPALQVVSCWADAHARGPALDLQRRMPGVVFQPKGLLATEAFVTVPFRGRHPLAVSSHFFEFIAEDGSIATAAQLQRGASYEVVVTTGGGLWRYRLGDRVEVTGFVGRTPSLRFLGRVGRVSDRSGEKLSDAFVARVLAELCPHAPFAMLAPEERSGQWHYALFLHSPLSHLPDPVTLDAALYSNPHYALCRRLGQLNAPRVVPLPGDAYERYTTAECARGLRLGDIKPVALSLRTDWAEKFCERPDAKPVQTPVTHSSLCKSWKSPSPDIPSPT